MSTSLADLITEFFGRHQSGSHKEGGELVDLDQRNEYEGVK